MDFEYWIPPDNKDEELHKVVTTIICECESFDTINDDSNKSNDYDSIYNN